MIGASDLRMNLLVGDEVTHYTNVPCVEEAPEGDSLLSHDDTTDHDTTHSKNHLNISLDGLKVCEIDKENVISDLQGTNKEELCKTSDISEPQKTITTPVNSKFGNRVISELLPVKYYPSICHHSISGSRINSKKINKHQ